MDPHALALPEDLDLDEVRRRLGRLSAHLALELYVVDREQRLVGSWTCATRSTRHAAGRSPIWCGRSSLCAPRPTPRRSTRTRGGRSGARFPVVDEGGLFLGAVRAERLRQMIHGADGRRRRAGQETVVALGELYWLGLSGLFTGLARREGREEEEG